MLKALPGIEEVSLTTNGVLLEQMAPELAQAGLDRVNVSLDTLDPARYARLTRGGQVKRAWRGIAAAEAAGLTPIKINVVAVRGLNDDELPTLARITLEHAWHVRIIELMPVGDPQMWG
jgi:cyclic pyranopterin phosphate synthase